MSPSTLDDAMPGRGLLARWVVRGTLTLVSAMHLGAESTERVDMPVLRDPLDGRPLLPGTTLAGALRNALADRLVGYGKPEPTSVSALFGGERGDDQGAQSPLIVFDSAGELPDDHGIEIRDGVAVAPSTGTAEDHKKYEYEVLPAGTRFPVRVDLLVPAASGDDRDAAQEEQPLLASLAAALEAFSHGHGAFGAKRTRGLGTVQATWAARRFDLDSRPGWLAWLRSDHEQPFTDAAERDIYDALEAAAPAALAPISAIGDARRRVVIDLDLRIAQDLLVRSPGDEPDAPDVSHLHSGGHAILPGTSLAGVLRAQALRVARQVRRNENDAERWIDRLFGPRFEGQRPTGALEPHASRLRIGEGRIVDSRTQRQARVAIDRFTQGAVDTALFEEQTEVAGHTTARLELRGDEVAELGLVLLALKDLLDGSLAVGGTSSIGRGVLRGSASITWNDGSDKAARTAQLEPGAAPSGDAADEIDEAIRAFHQAEALTPPAAASAAEPGESE